MLPLLVHLFSSGYAFCGFYVSGADGSLYNDATMVVMMRSGTQTVLSMQNTYQGPPEAFAMVVPVPQVLKKKNVKTLDAGIFARVDRLAAPRLVAYWEQDPCFAPVVLNELRSMGYVASESAATTGLGGSLGVRIEAQFEVGEYDIVILSASDSSGLDTWLRREKYNIPAGADTVLEPYVAAGTKFFVAKVDPERVTFRDGRAVLSPLRVHYDSETFSLPVRLGLLNSKGQQDLIVHILSPGQRYDVANYRNAFIPTNLRVQPAVEDNFGGFYDALFSEVAKDGTVVTEYSWDATWCDPCPQPALSESELMTLGNDVVKSAGFVLTRLHHRYGAEGLDEDLVFRAAEPVAGGQGTPNQQGEFTQQGANPTSSNTFQGRYAILHRWEGEVKCESPIRGMWGGPPQGGDRTLSATSRVSSPSVPPKMALASALVDPIPGVTKVDPAPKAPNVEEVEDESLKPSRGCSTAPAYGWVGLGALVLGFFRRRYRKLAVR